MKKLIVVLMLLITSLLNAQVSQQTSTVTSLIFTVDTVNELKTIKWEDVKEVFNDEQESNEIKLGCRVRNHPVNKNKDEEYKHSFEVKGTVKSLESLIKLANKMTNVIVKFNKE